MTQQRGDGSLGQGAKAAKAHGFLGSLKDALLAASRDETAPAAHVVIKPSPMPVSSPVKDVIALGPPALSLAVSSPSAEEAARIARASAVTKAVEAPAERIPVIIDIDAPPTTRVVRGQSQKDVQPKPDRTQLIRGRQAIARNTFEQDPVVGFLIVVGGPGLGAFRPIYEGNNTVGRSVDNRVPLDFGDDTISSEAQAYIRYDSTDRSFLFVPNLAKTNVVSVNDKRPTGATTLKPMDVITFGRTQVAFVAFCGTEFDWSEISET